MRVILGRIDVSLFGMNERIAAKAIDAYGGRTREHAGEEAVADPLSAVESVLAQS